MKNKNYKTLTIRLEETDLEKLRQIAEEEGRFVSQMAAWMVHTCIRDCEKKQEEAQEKM